VTEIWGGAAAPALPSHTGGRGISEFSQQAKKCA
jgi:hypothetical protein